MVRAVKGLKFGSGAIRSGTRPVALATAEGARNFRFGDFVPAGPGLRFFLCRLRPFLGDGARAGKSRFNLRSQPCYWRVSENTLIQWAAFADLARGRTGICTSMPLPMSPSESLLREGSLYSLQSWSTAMACLGSLPTDRFDANSPSSVSFCAYELISLVGECSPPMLLVCLEFIPILASK